MATITNWTDDYGVIRDVDGRIVNQAQARRAHAARRAALIAELNMAPETDFTYAATTGELQRWVNEDRAKNA